VQDVERVVEDVVVVLLGAHEPAGARLALEHKRTRAKRTRGGQAAEARAQDQHVALYESGIHDVVHSGIMPCATSTWTTCNASRKSTRCRVISPGESSFRCIRSRCPRRR